MIRARWVVLAVLAAAALALVVTWRLDTQTVNVVVVNSSGRPAQFSWQPALFAPETSKTIGGCESTSIELRAGESWQLSSGNFGVSSASVQVPLLVREVGFEVWLTVDGSNRVVSAYPIESPINAPYPPACATIP